MGLTAHQHKKAISRRKSYKSIRPIRISHKCVQENKIKLDVAAVFNEGS